MRIPKKFKIGRKQYVVVQRPSLWESRKGFISYMTQNVLLATHRFNKPRSARDISKTFWHEVMHGVLHDMGHPLRDDEKFVEGVAKRLNQVVHTAVL